MTKKTITKHLPLAVAIWLCAVGIGMAAMWRHEGAAGERAKAPSAWPAEFTMKPAPSGITVLVTLHPNCVCSNATLGELARIMARKQYGIDARVIMTGIKSDELNHSKLCQTAKAIPGVSLIADPDGSMSARLGAKTSGQTFAFDSTGKMLFSGGITPARGHMGENVGEDALLALVMKHQPSRQESPVFGCPLIQRGS